MISTRLVIAHENEAVRQQLRTALEAFGHFVVGEGAEAEAAQRLCERLRPDVVVLGASSVADGSFESARAIQTGVDVAVFFLCETYDPDLLDRARQVGCAGFLVQPFSDVALEIALRMALDRRAERDSLRRELAAMKEKLEARKLISRAKAILMERHGLTEPEAFRRLQLQSMSTATPMKTLAEAVILGSQVLEAEEKQRRPTA